MAIETGEKYCPICGRPGRSELNRFGEWACSEAHADEHAADVRGQTQRRAVGVDSGRSAQADGRHRRGCC